MKLEPLHDKVIIRPKKAPTQTATGLHLAEHAKPEQVGTVISVGKAATKTGVQPGDTVLFSWQSGQEILVDDEGARVLVMLEEDLLAIIGQGVSVEAEELIL